MNALVDAAPVSLAQAQVEATNCRLCGAGMQSVFRKVLLEHHDVQFFQCSHCRAMQTEQPYWLAEAYVPQNERFDTGQVTRSLINAAFVAALLKAADIGRARVVDYGCGSGLCVRSLRDAGIDAWGYDRYAEPRLALAYRTDDYRGFDVLNLCEVMEHFDQPRQALDDIFSGDPLLVVVQTGIMDRPDPEWGYLAPDHGQHIFFLAPTTVNWISGHYERFVLSVMGFQVFIAKRLALRLLDPATGQLRAEHEKLFQSCIGDLWQSMFARPYLHASNDLAGLRQRHA